MVCEHDDFHARAEFRYLRLNTLYSRKGLDHLFKERTIIFRHYTALSPSLCKGGYEKEWYLSLLGGMVSEDSIKVVGTCKVCILSRIIATATFRVRCRILPLPSSLGISKLHHVYQTLLASEGRSCYYPLVFPADYHY